MKMLQSRISSALRNLFRKHRIERQLDDEIRAYVDLATDEKIAAGMPPLKARQTVLAEFGGIEPVKEAVREGRSGAGLERLWLDVRYGSRRLWRNPGLTVTALLTLALSIGANTAIFSVVNALLLKKLPWVHPETLGTIYSRVTGPGGYDERHKINGEQWELLRDDAPSLIAAVSSGRTAGVNLQAGTHVRFLHAGRVSAHYLDVLGLHPFMGRSFSDAEDRAGGPKTAVLSYGLWRETFDSDPEIVGRNILLKGEPYTVIGVLAQGATTPLAADLYTALQATRKGEGAGTNFEVITRLRQGAVWQRADAEINRAWALRAQRFELEGNPGAHVTWYSVSLQQGQTAKLRPQVLALLLAAGLILLIACANLAGLTLIRMLRRAPEVATRLALGASQWNIQRQLWIENLLLALLGGTCGLATGFAALRGLLLLLPEHFLPVADVPLDRSVLAFTLLISLATSVLFGMLPALETRRFDLRSGLARSRSVIGGERLRLRQALIATEIAVTVVLLAASGLLIRTLIYLQTLPPGFNPNGVMAATVSLDDARFHDAAAFQELLSQSMAAMRQIPAVRSAAVGLSLPYERSLILGGLGIRDGKEAGQRVTMDETYVTPGYFETLQIPILAGRSFTDADGPDAQPVAIVNRTFARRFFHGANPVGRHVGNNTIVGLVEDVAMAPGIDAVAPLTGEQTMYIPAAQVGAQLLGIVHTFFQPSWIVRTAGPVEGLTAQMQRAMASVNPNLPFSGFYNMSDLQAETLAMQRIEVALLSALSGLALLLSAVGIFALVANIVAQRTREIGLRIALGSTIRQTMVHVGAPGLGASASGLIAGLLLCAGTLRAMRSVVYGVGVYDVPTLIVVAFTLAAVAAVATGVPILRIARIDPAKTLRDE